MFTALVDELSTFPEYPTNGFLSYLPLRKHPVYPFTHLLAAQGSSMLVLQNIFRGGFFP